MEKHLLKFLVPVLGIVMGLSLISYTGGGFSSDRTGGPGGNAAGCQSCHSTFGLNSGSGSISMTLPATYYPGETYTVSLDLSQSSPSPAKHGFMAVSLRDNNTAGGTFTAGTGSATTTISSKSYIKQTSLANTTGSWSFSWTAPSYSDTVNFYYCGVAANGANGNANDYVYKNSSTVLPLPLITFSKDSSNVLCFGGSDGMASLDSIEGGAGGPYSFDWNTGDTTSSIGSLTAGIYTCTVTDNDGHEEEVEFNISQPQKMVLNFNIIPSSCAFGSGEVSVEVFNGTGSIDYLWNDVNATTDSVIMNASNQWYTVTVTDANGCTEVDSTFVGAAGSGLVGQTLDSDENCGNSDGSLTQQMFIGNPPYSYAWNTGSTSQTASGLSAGIYTVTVTDAIGCTEVYADTVHERFAVIDKTSGVIDNPCYESNAASITVSITSGTAPFSYTWSHGDSVGSVSSLFNGSYSVTVTDSAGCTDTASYVISSPDSIEVVSVVDSANEGFCDGSITLSTSGGVPGYTYTWSHDAGLSGNMADNLCAGDYQITIKDANNCLRSVSIEVDSVLGIVDNFRGNLKVFPNPVTNQLFLSGDVQGISTLAILDISGRPLKRWNTFDFGPLNVEELAKGSYFLIIEHRHNEVSVHQFTKN